MSTYISIPIYTGTYLYTCVYIYIISYPGEPRRSTLLTPHDAANLCCVCIPLKTKLGWSTPYFDFHAESATMLSKLVEQLDRTIACFTACVHKTLNSHSSMEILAISATMMAYLRAVHDQTN